MAPGITRLGRLLFRRWVGEGSKNSCSRRLHLTPSRWIRRDACGAITREPNRRGYRLCHPSQVFFSFLIPTVSRPKSPPGTRTRFIIAMYFPDERGRSFIVTVFFFFFLIKNRKHVVGREYRRRPLPTSWRIYIYIFQRRDLPRAAQTRHRAINNTQIRFNKLIKRLDVSTRPSPLPPQFTEPSSSIGFLSRIYTPTIAPRHCPISVNMNFQLQILKILF